MAEIQIYNDKKKMWKLLIASIVVISFGIVGVMLLDNNLTNYLLSWLMLICGVFCLGIYFYNIFDKRPQILISEKGIWDRTNKQEMLNWEQILEASQVDINGQIFITIEVDDTFVFNKMPNKLGASLNKMIGVHNYNLNITMLDIEGEEIIKLIAEMSNETNEKRSLILSKYSAIFNN